MYAECFDVRSASGRCARQPLATTGHHSRIKGRHCRRRRVLRCDISYFDVVMERLVFISYVYEPARALLCRSHRNSCKTAAQAGPRRGPSSVGHDWCTVPMYSVVSPPLHAVSILLQLRPQNSMRLGWDTKCRGKGRNGLRIIY